MDFELVAERVDLLSHELERSTDGHTVRAASFKRRERGQSPQPKHGVDNKARGPAMLVTIDERRLGMVRCQRPEHGRVNAQITGGRHENHSRPVVFSVAADGAGCLASTTSEPATQGTHHRKPNPGRVTRYGHAGARS